jgi:hypothetical protein
MIIAPVARTDADEQVYGQAVARLVKELGWSTSKAHSALADAAQAYGVFLDDIARVILGARSLKRGMSHALRGSQFDRRPPSQRL